MGALLPFPFSPYPSSPDFPLYYPIISLPPLFPFLPRPRLMGLGVLTPPAGPGEAQPLNVDLMHFGLKSAFGKLGMDGYPAPASGSGRILGAG